MEAYGLLGEKILMVMTAMHAMMISGVPVTRLKVCLRGEKAFLCCVQEDKHMPPLNIMDFSSCTFWLFFFADAARMRMGKGVQDPCSQLWFPERADLKEAEAERWVGETETACAQEQEVGAGGWKSNTEAF